MTVTLTGTDVSNNSVSLSTTTLPDGTFAFNGVLPGNYNITKVQPIGYMDGRETAGNLGGMVNNGTDSGAIYEIVIGNEGVAATNYLFGNLRASAVSGYVWQDLNNDGNIDGNEGSVPGVTINLTGTDDRANTVIQAVNTNLDGSYSFLGLRPGTYSVSQVQPAGFLDGLDMLGTVNGIGAGTNAVNDVFSGLRLNRSGSIAENYNLGERILPVVVSGRVYNDRNNNGSFNSGAGEFGIAGVLVTLTGYDNFDNSVILSTTTLSDGSFAFHGVFPGTYTLTSDANDSLEINLRTMLNNVFSTINESGNR